MWECYRWFPGDILGQNLIILLSYWLALLHDVTCFCNVYARILIKYQLHFDFLVVFTLLLWPCQLLYHVSRLLYNWACISFFCTNEWWAITSNNILWLFKATLQHRLWFGNFLHHWNSAVYCCQKAFHCSQNLRLLQPALLQLFCSVSWSHSSVLQQHCLFRTGIFTLGQG